MIKQGEVAEKQEEIDQLRKTLTDMKYDNETYQQQITTMELSLKSHWDLIDKLQEESEQSKMEQHREHLKTIEQLKSDLGELRETSRNTQSDLYVQLETLNKEKNELTEIIMDKDN